MNARLIISIITSAVIFSGTTALAGNVKVDLNFSLGGLYPPIVVHEQLYRPAGAQVRHAPAPFYPRQEEVRFIYPDELGFYVAVGLPYELCYINRSYYLFDNGVWLRAVSQRGPWMRTSYRELPPVLRRHSIERIRDYRQHGYERMKRWEREERREPSRYQGQERRDADSGRHPHDDRNVKGEKSRGDQVRR